MSAIFTDRVNTATIAYADEREEPIWNANTAITIGGVVKSQADSQRLRVEIDMRLTQAEHRSLMTVLKDFAVPLYYTPNRLLYDKATNEEMQVIVTSPPKITDRAYDGCNVIFYVSMEVEEVLTD